MKIKKFFVNIWNFLYEENLKFKDFLYRIYDFFYCTFHKPPIIMSCEDTIKYILDNKCSVSRFGDAELKLVSGRNVVYQISTPEIRDRLNEVLASNKDNLLVCLPSVFSNEQLSNRRKEYVKFWKKHLSYCRKYWYKNLIPNKVYGNAFISRHYIALKDKTNGIEEYFDLIKLLWENRDIIIVEGEKSRLGVNNDLFDNAKSVKRILGPSTQSFSRYNDILEEIKKQDNSSLFLLAMGPTASILPIDICDLGYQAIDLGNIDTEYEWYKMKATDKVPIKSKLVYEAFSGLDIEDVDDPKYKSEIIARIY